MHSTDDDCVQTIIQKGFEATLSVVFFKLSFLFHIVNLRSYSRLFSHFLPFVVSGDL